MLQNLAFTIENLKNAYKNGLSPQDVINEIFDRIKIINDPNIFINLLTLESLNAEAKKFNKYE